MRLLFRAHQRMEKRPPLNSVVISQACARSLAIGNPLGRVHEPELSDGLVGNARRLTWQDWRVVRPHISESALVLVRNAGAYRPNVKSIGAAALTKESRCLRDRGDGVEPPRGDKATTVPTTPRSPWPTQSV